MDGVVGVGWSAGVEGEVGAGVNIRCERARNL